MSDGLDISTSPRVRTFSCECNRPWRRDANLKDVSAASIATQRLAQQLANTYTRTRVWTAWHTAASIFSGLMVWSLVLAVPGRRVVFTQLVSEAVKNLANLAEHLVIIGLCCLVNSQIGRLQTSVHSSLLSFDGSEMSTPVTAMPVSWVRAK